MEFGVNMVLVLGLEIEASALHTDQPGQHSVTLSLLKSTKISQMWLWVPVIPATQEAEVEELLEPRRTKEKLYMNGQSDQALDKNR
ncbi:hypothetical protein AAY473_007985 [Plecturocebus cupreus]